MPAMESRHSPGRARRSPPTRCGARSPIARRSRRGSANGSTSICGLAARGWSSTSGVTREVIVDSVDEGRGWSFEWSVDEAPVSRRDVRDLEQRRRRQPADDHRDVDRRRPSQHRCGWLPMGSVRAAAVGVHGRRRVRAVSALDDLFSALSDPTRRALFDRLLRDGPDTATRLARAHDAHAAGGRQASPGAGRGRSGRAAARSGVRCATRRRPNRWPTVVAWLTESSRGWDRRTARLASVSRRLASDRRR